jgi:hypothetical protein
VSLGRLEMDHLIERAHALLAAQGERAIALDRRALAVAELARRSGLRPRGEGPPELGVGRPIGVELGHPATLSVALLLTTARPALVRDRRITRLGAELDELARRPGPVPFAQLVLLELDAAAAPDLFALAGAGELVHRLSGYAPRLLRAGIWARVAREAIDAGFSIARLGEALCAAHLELAGVRAVEVALLLGDRSLCTALAPLRAEAELRFGRHRRLVLAENADADAPLEAECRELDCERCDERPVCDSLRDVRIRRRRAR